MIKYSIIIPVYNAEKQLKRCIESIINQSYDNYELLLINDGSKDNSLYICNKYKSNKVRIINKKNEGVSCSRNLGLLYATGNYIMFVDSDDWLELNALEKITKIISKNPNIEILKFNYYHETNKRLFKNNIDKLNIIFNKLYTANEYNKIICDTIKNSYFINTVWGEVIKKEVLLNVMFEKNIIYGEDLLFNTYLFMKASNIMFIDEYLYHYFINESGISLNISYDILEKKINDLLYIYPIIISNISKIDINNDFKLIDKFVKELTENLVKLCNTSKEKNDLIEFVKVIRNKKASFYFEKINIYKYINYKYFILLYMLKKRHFNNFYEISNKLYKKLVFILKINKL